METRMFISIGMPLTGAHRAVQIIDISVYDHAEIVFTRLGTVPFPLIGPRKAGLDRFAGAIRAIRACQHKRSVEKTGFLV
jgi:hypothetical protein